MAGAAVRCWLAARRYLVRLTPSMAPGDPELPRDPAAALRAPLRRSLEYINGYLSLGLARDAQAELDQIDPSDRRHPWAVQAEMGILYALGEWKTLEDISRKYVTAHPGDIEGWINVAFALRRTAGVADAKAALLDVPPGLGVKSAILQYNLACYHAVLGEETEAKDRLRRALALEPELQAQAVQDEDLRTLWTEIDRLLPKKRKADPN